MDRWVRGKMRDKEHKSEHVSTDEFLAFLTKLKSLKEIALKWGTLHIVTCTYLVRYFGRGILENS